MSPRPPSHHGGQTLTPEGPVNTSKLPSDLAVLPIDQITPCPIQPRVHFAVDLLTHMARSMREGRHHPLLEVEPAPDHPGLYQIVCGEQRWRAAKAAGLAEVVVRVHQRLGYLERLERQYEENHLRSDLDPIESAQLVQLDHVVRCAHGAEQLLEEAEVPFERLEQKYITRREQFVEHLEGLTALLIRKKVHVVRTADGRLGVGPLAPWRETEEALGISESARKAKVGLLRLDRELQEEVRTLPAEHAIQISRLGDTERQAELVARAPRLTHRQVHAAVDRLRRDPALSVDDALAPEGGASPDPLAFERQLAALSDLCRQLLRMLDNLDRRLNAQEHEEVLAVVASLGRAIAVFEEGSGHALPA